MNRRQELPQPSVNAQVPSALFEHAQRQLENKTSPMSQKLQIFHTNIGVVEAKFVGNMLKKHESVKAIQLRAATFSSELVATDFILQIKNTTLFSLLISSCRFTQDMVLCLAASMQETTLRRLELVQAEVDDKGAIAIAYALPHCYSLNSLNLSSNNIGHIGGLALAQRSWDSAITTLNLSSNALGPAVIQELAKHLPKTAIKTLSLNSTQMKNQGMLALCNALPHCAELETLSIGGNQLGNDMLALLCTVINKCPKLKSLDISSNNVTELGLLGNVLAENFGIESISLRDNSQLGDEQVQKLLCTALKSHATLSSIDLQKTAVSADMLLQVRNKLVALHDARSKIMVALVSAKTSRRLGARSALACALPNELFRLLKDML